MGRIFISAGHGGFEDQFRDPGFVFDTITEAQEMILIRNLMVPQLRSRGFEVLSVPDELSLQQTLDWINVRAREGDVALEIHASASGDPIARGTTIFYIANNARRQGHAELLLLKLLGHVPFPSRGARPDTDSGLGSLSFCRRLVIPSLLIEIGFLTNPEDRILLRNRRRDVANGLSSGLETWSRAVSDGPTAGFPEIGINVNGRQHGERGLIINSNAYVPINLADQLGVDLTSTRTIRRVNFRNIVYVKAIDLRDFDISIGWDRDTRTVLLRSVLRLCPGSIDRIMGHGNTSEQQLTHFLNNNNEKALAEFPDLPKLYREEASVEGVNYDIAFAQMCLETSFLRFEGAVSADQNNFANLGSTDATASGAIFPSARLGVRGQIQHLKAYASTQPLVQEQIDPRFAFVPRGRAPLIEQLSGRWSADLEYGNKVKAILRRLYEFASLL